MPQIGKQADSKQSSTSVSNVQCDNETIKSLQAKLSAALLSNGYLQQEITSYKHQIVNFEHTLGENQFKSIQPKVDSVKSSTSSTHILSRSYPASENKIDATAHVDGKVEEYHSPQTGSDIHDDGHHGSQDLHHNVVQKGQAVTKDVKQEGKQPLGKLAQDGKDPKSKSKEGGDYINSKDAGKTKELAHDSYVAPQDMHKDVKQDGKLLKVELAQDGKIFNSGVKEDGQAVEKGQHFEGEQDDETHEEKEGTATTHNLQNDGNDVDDYAHHNGQKIDYTFHHVGKETNSGLQHESDTFSSKQYNHNKSASAKCSAEVHAGVQHGPKQN